MTDRRRCLQSPVCYLCCAHSELRRTINFTAAFFLRRQKSWTKQTLFGECNARSRRINYVFVKQEAYPTKLNKLVCVPPRTWLIQWSVFLVFFAKVLPNVPFSFVFQCLGAQKERKNPQFLVSSWTFNVERDKKKPSARKPQRNKHLAGGVATYLRHVTLRYEWHHKGLFSGTVLVLAHTFWKERGTDIIACLVVFTYFSDTADILLTYYCLNNVQQICVFILDVVEKIETELKKKLSTAQVYRRLIQSHDNAVQPLQPIWLWSKIPNDT